jgi:hypothetical protein
MKNKKIFILLPDGIGLRNFAFSNFFKIGKEKNFAITYWNNTPFDLASLGFDEVKITEARSNPLTDSYKNARKHIELNLNKRREKDNVYNSYRFPFSYKKLKPALKNLVTRFLIATHSSSKGLQIIRQRIKKLEGNTPYYRKCLETLQKEKPELVFCTNQRPVLAIAPLLAAKALKIPTVTFIFSWDNLPKATMVVETDYYVVWSEHMKKELLHYYSYIEENQVFVTGTPQFENHFDLKLRLSREQFYKEQQLDLNKKYICYSGDDVTTCPDDPQYLKDTARAIRKLNSQGHALGIIFRRCPVDFSNRFDLILTEFSDVIFPVSPLWKSFGEGWNTVLPTVEDLILQTNTILHSEMVINLGSSMVFDFASYQKPCAYLNYDVINRINKNWSVNKIYKYIHFRSMPDKNSVIWINSADEIADKINSGLNHNNEIVNYAQKWFEEINQSPPENASNRIWESIEVILSN